MAAADFRELSVETRCAGRQDKEDTRPSREAAQRICRETRLHPNPGARRLARQGQWPRIRRPEARGAPIALRPAARVGRVLEKLGGDQGITKGLLFGNFAIVALSMFRVSATISGGEWVSQSDSETSA